MEQQDFLTNLHYVPIFIVIFIPCICIITYVTAVTLDHVEAGFPYISDTATFPPESCIFAQLMNMLAILLLAMVYIKYCHLKECSALFSLKSSLPKWNYWSVVVGVTAIFGMTVIANFQETAALSVHFVGALLFFGGGTIYFWLQALCTFYLHPLGYSTRLTHIRTVLSIVATLTFITALTTGILSRIIFKGTNPQKWHKKDGGFELHLISSVTEWICAGAFVLYIFTFTGEFKDIKISHPKAVYMVNRTRLNDEALSESQNATLHQEQDSPRVS